MKTKQLEELKNASKEELLAKLEELKKELFNLKFKHSIVKVKNPLQIRTLRRDIARVKTLLRMRFNIKV